MEDSFLEDEVRDGFFVSSIVKRSWANVLELLYELDRICVEHGIDYSLDWGSMLGAVRHGGFIPWDDDVDVVMHRGDLERFREAIKEELPGEYCFIDFESSDHHWKFIVAFANHSKMCFEPDYLEAHYNFPYIASIDIFVLDHVSDDAAREEKRCSNVIFALNAAEVLRTNALSDRERAVLLDKMKREYGISFETGSSDLQIRREIFRYIKGQLCAFDKEECTYVAQMIPAGIRKCGYYPPDYARKTKRIRFESIDVNICENAEELLSWKYRNYQVPFRDGTLHDYPYFESQRKELGAQMSYIREYPYQPDAMNVVFDDSFSLKRMAAEYIENLSEKISGCYRRAASTQNAAWGEAMVDLLASEQEMAIDFGTLIERVRGEGTQTVAMLEQYCEELYLAIENSWISETLSRLAEALIVWITNEIISRKEIVFVAYKAAFWSSFEVIWERLQAEKEPNCDIYVLPVPYAHKRYDGSSREWIYDTEGYPEGLALKDYATYDFSLHCPEAVYIQNPCDEYNLATTVMPQFYASAIRPYTKELVFVPYFDMDDFGENDRVQKYNMQYFCRTPGVALADRILLPSEALAERYKEMLTEWAGAETGAVWERKICVQANEL